MRPHLYILWLVAAVLMLLAMSALPNPAHEYCTTKAYGVPFVHQIDYCECDGMSGITKHHPESYLYNFAIALGATFPLLLIVKPQNKR